MLIKTALVGIIVALICALQSSTTHYEPIVRHYFLETERENAYESLWLSAKNGSQSALSALVQLATINHEEHWLSKAATLDNIEAQLALAKLSKGEEKAFWWQQAAKNGHAPSQFELFLVESDRDKKLAYLRQSAQNDYSAAIIALGDYYYDHQLLDEAQIWLEKAAHIDAQSAFKFARVLWNRGDFDKASQQFALAAEQIEAYQAYARLSKLPKNQLKDLAVSVNELHDSCSQQIQIVATSLDSRVQAEGFINRFKQDPRFTSLPICINEAIWVDKNELACVNDGERKVCNFQSLANQVFSPSFSHLVLIVESSKAYVNNGLMVLDESDVYSVFIHELAHFVGFVDEYAVNPDLSKHYCNNAYAPNLLVAEENEITQHETYDLWRAYIASLNEQVIEQADANNADIDNLLSLQIAKSNTCSKLSISAYKPSNEITFLEYHDTQNIPEIYIAMWQDLLVQYHHELAIAQMFEQHASESASKAHWRQMLE